MNRERMDHWSPGGLRRSSSASRGIRRSGALLACLQQRPAVGRLCEEGRPCLARAGDLDLQEGLSAPARPCPHEGAAGRLPDRILSAA